MSKPLEVGDYAKSIESGWLGKIIAFEMHDDCRMAKMMGVDWFAAVTANLTREEALSPDDIQWFDPRDLKRA